MSLPTRPRAAHASVSSSFFSRHVIAGLGAEYQDGKYIHYPQDRLTQDAAAEADSCTLIGEYSGTKQIWKCSERGGNNCEEEMINGEMSWICYV